MKTIYIDRSTGAVRDGDWVEALDLAGVTRIVVGTGPGSFAGIRSALAFAQGYHLGTGCEVRGLPSACAIAAELGYGLGTGGELAVIGDARRGKFWIAHFTAEGLAGDVFQVEADALAAAVPPEARVTTPDAARIENLLKATFGTRYLCGTLPTGAGLETYAARHPEALVAEPLPIYLNPAVRD